MNRCPADIAVYGDGYNCDRSVILSFVFGRPSLKSGPDTDRLRAILWMVTRLVRLLRGPGRILGKTISVSVHVSGATASVINESALQLYVFVKLLNVN